MVASFIVVKTSKIQGFRAKDNTYQIVYTGNSGIAMDGAGVRSAKDV